MADAINLDAYLARIGWQGEKAPTYKTLAGVLDAHTAHIPFENLDVLLGRPIQLDISGLQSKLVDARRGGYCFEHASLMAAALEALGFEIARHTARVVLFTSAKEAPRSHMFLTVAADGRRFVVDPGFGPFTAGSPVPMDGTATPEGHRMTRDGEVWVRHGSTPRCGVQRLGLCHAGRQFGRLRDGELLQIDTPGFAIPALDHGKLGDPSWAGEHHEP